MQRSAVHAARDCLARARSAHDRLRAADSFAKSEAAWTDLLVMGNRVYARLEQGAKGNGSSFGWFGEKKHQRRKDKLLSYVKNERDADEHGLAQVTVRNLGTTTIEFPKGAVVSGTYDKGDLNLTLAEPRPVEVTIRGPHIQLAPVTNHGDRYDPPDSSPIAVAETFLAQLESIIGEAEARLAD